MRGDSKQSLPHDILHGREGDEEKIPDLRGIGRYHGGSIHQHTLKYTTIKGEQ